MVDSPKGRTLTVGAGALILVLAFPPLPLGFLAWFALIPLLFAVEKAATSREATRLGAIFGFVLHTGTMW